MIELAEEAGWQQSLKRMPTVSKRMVCTASSSETGEETYGGLVNFLISSNAAGGVRQFEKT